MNTLSKFGEIIDGFNVNDIPVEVRKLLDDAAYRFETKFDTYSKLNKLAESQAGAHPLTTHI